MHDAVSACTLQLDEAIFILEQSSVPVSNYANHALVANASQNNASRLPSDVIQRQTISIIANDLHLYGTDVIIYS